jgi:hypothetical protein
MPKLEKAFIAIQGKQFPVMYNPTEYSSSMTALYGGPDESDKKNQFQQTQNDNFSISLFFDTSETQSDVRLEMKPIADLILPTVKKRKFKEPPVCTFVWGKFNYRGVIINQSQKFTLFLASGIPIRGTLNLTFESRLNESNSKALSNRSSSRKFWTVKAGDRLDLVAYKTLDSVGNWKAIANLNNINDPLLFPRGSEKGRQIVIPDLG